MISFTPPQPLVIDSTRRSCRLESWLCWLVLSALIIGRQQDQLVAAFLLPAGDTQIVSRQMRRSDATNRMLPSIQRLISIAPSVRGAFRATTASLFSRKESRPHRYISRFSPFDNSSLGGQTRSQGPRDTLAIATRLFATNTSFMGGGQLDSPEGIDGEEHQRYTSYEKWVRRLYLTNLFHPVKMGLANMQQLHSLLGCPMDDVSTLL